MNTAVGAFFSASGQKTALNATANTAEQNAKFAELAAQQTLAAGQAEEQQIDRNTAQVKGAQVADMAANGVNPNVGTGAAIQAGTDLMGQNDALTARKNAIMAAFGQRVESTNYSNEANMARAQAKGISPVTSAATSLLGSAGQLSQRWYQLSRSGALPSTGIAPAGT